MTGEASGNSSRVSPSISSDISIPLAPERISGSWT